MIYFNKNIFLWCSYPTTQTFKLAALVILNDSRNRCLPIAPLVSCVELSHHGSHQVHTTKIVRQRPKTAPNSSTNNATKRIICVCFHTLNFLKGTHIQTTHDRTYSSNRLKTHENHLPAHRDNVSSIRNPKTLCGATSTRICRCANIAAKWSHFGWLQAREEMFGVCVLRTV